MVEVHIVALVNTEKEVLKIWCFMRKEDAEDFYRRMKKLGYDVKLEKIDVTI